MSVGDTARNSYPRHVYRVQVNLLGTLIAILDEQGNTILNCRIKDKGNDSELTLSRGKKGGAELMKIVPVYEKPKGLLRRALHFLSRPSHFDVVDLEAGGSKVGAVKREFGGGSPQEYTWTILDGDNAEIGALKPVSTGFLGGSFQHRGQIGSNRVCEFKAGNTIAGRYVEADFTVDEYEDLDVRLGLAIAVKIVVAMVEMHSSA